MTRSIFESSFYRGLEAMLLFTMSIVVSRSLGAHDFGIVSYSLFLLSVFSIISPLGFTTSSLRFVAEYIEKKDNQLLLGFVARSIQFTLLTSFIMALLLYFVADVYFSGEDIYYSIYWAAILLPVAALVQLRRKITEASGGIATSVLPDLAMPILVIMVVIVFEINEYSQIYSAILISSLLGLLIGLYIMWGHLPKISNSLSRVYKSKHWLLVSVPMVAAGLGNVLMNRSDILILGMFTDMGDVGKYTAAVRVVMLAVFILNAVYVVVAPGLSRMYFSGQIDMFIAHLKKSTYLSIAGGALVIVPLFIWPGEILGVFGEEYSEAKTVLIVLALSQCVHVVLGLGTITLALIGYEKIFAITVLGGACLNIVGNIIAAPKWGALGVAFVTLCSTLILKLVQIYLLARVLRAAKRNSIGVME